MVKPSLTFATDDINVDPCVGKVSNFFLSPVGWHYLVLQTINWNLSNLQSYILFCSPAMGIADNPPSYAESNDITILRQPSSSVFLNTDYVSQTEQRLRIVCHDTHFRQADVSNDDGQKVFTVTRKGMLSSYSGRKYLLDATGKHIFDFRHYNSTTTLRKMIIESPDQKELCRIHDLGGNPTTCMEIIVPMKTGEVVLKLRSNDRSGSTTIFEVNDVQMAELVRTENNDHRPSQQHGLPRSVWKLQIAAGVDTAMAVAVAFCRIEVAHLKRR